MGVTFTREQQQVIDLRNRNILVSAAAGSGKTAVLVERIITRLTKDENPIDVDQLLIVTYTEAAASEMKERIRDAIEKALEQDPENTYLQRQATLVHSAQVTTIHSFCLSVIRDYFHVIDLDPGFRIGEEGELKLLKRDVLEELLESYYESGNQQFLDFTECFSSGRDDKKIEEVILQLFEFSRSYPNPREWLMQCVEAYDVPTTKKLEASEMARQIRTRVQLFLQDLKTTLYQGLEVCDAEDGPYMYRAALEADLQVVQMLEQASSFENLCNAAGGIKWARLAVNRDKSVSEERAAFVKGVREEVKKTISGIAEQYFFDTPEELCRDMAAARENMRILAHLVMDFADAFAEKKRSKNMIDFGDMEHFALQILNVQKEEYQERFAEIMIDEYQDSNLIQEAILTSVSKVSKGIYNIFMVGDVKQSIYRFRLSRPELFMEKFDTYSQEESEKQRIDLHKNFRSRREVLDSTNFLFGQIMTKGLGGIVYDDQAALYVGASYEEQPGNETEILLVDTDVEEAEDLKVEETNRELEARAVARRIKELVGTHPVLDKQTGEYRPATYRDIVILTRSLKGWTDVFTKILNREGIPAYSTSKEGYFETREIQTILDYLKILDNPRQDIPFTAVLVSCFGGISNEELALLKCHGEEKTMYEHAHAYVEDGGEEALRERLRLFFEQYERFRGKVPYTSIHELLWNIIEETGYGNYVAAMPGGEQRTANLEMLIEKAVRFESTSYKGLFHFIRYIEQLHKYDVDYGEASIADEQADTVRLMSIHKSKGLEFPIVFVSGMSKRFNTQDTKGSIVIHPELGIGMDAVDIGRRTKAPTLLKKMIQREVLLENQGEELRVLYVALTRAKEKLILTGTVSKLEQMLKEYEGLRGRNETELTFSRLTKANSYFDWVLPAFFRNKSFAPILEKYGIPVPWQNPMYESEIPVKISYVGLEELVKEEVAEELQGAFTKELLLNWDTEAVYDARMRERLEEHLNFIYPYERERKYKQKMTVSELKKRAYLEAEAGEVLLEEPDVVPLLPKFFQEESVAEGTQRGSAYHKVLELLDFTKAYDENSLTAELETQKELGRLEKSVTESVKVQDILTFLQSSVGARISHAAKAGVLKKEQPFVLGVNAEEIYGETCAETVLIQGIIDVYFEEDGELVVLDYKTDRIFRKKTLQEKYHAQLEYYAMALERLTGKRVKEKIIYSFALKEEIEV